MEIKGNFKNFLVEELKKKDGSPFTKYTLIVDVPDKFPYMLASTVFKDDVVSQCKALKIGQPVELFCNVESREYNGKYYTECKAWKVVAGDIDVAPSLRTSTEQFEPAVDDANDDLPF